MSQIAYNMQNYITDSVGASDKVNSLPAVQVFIQPNNKTYKTIVTQLIAVPTTFGTIVQFKLPYSAHVKQISILPSSNASANGVTFTVYYGVHSIEGINNGQAGASVPMNFAFTDGEYPRLNIGDVITLNAGATTSGAYLQLAITVML